MASAQATNSSNEPIPRLPPARLKKALPPSIEWVRSSLQQLDLLEISHSVDSNVGLLIREAIRWAPFGGADAEYLLVPSGIDRRRLLDLLPRGALPGGQRQP